MSDPSDYSLTEAELRTRFSNLTVGNVATHTRDELTEQEATERLSAYGYFARLLDQCEVRCAKEV